MKRGTCWTQKATNPSASQREQQTHRAKPTPASAQPAWQRQRVQRPGQHHSPASLHPLSALQSCEGRWPVPWLSLQSQATVKLNVQALCLLAGMRGKLVVVEERRRQGQQRQEQGGCRAMLSREASASDGAAAPPSPLSLCIF